MIMLTRGKADTCKIMNYVRLLALLVKALLHYATCFATYLATNLF